MQIFKPELGTFLNTEDEGAQMFLAGYRVDPFVHLMFMCNKPQGSPGAPFYMIDLRDGERCDCPASRRCKHLRNLPELVRLTMAALDESGQGLEAKLLCDAWYAVTDGASQKQMRRAA